MTTQTIKHGEKTLLKLDLGCGQSRREGFLGVDCVKTPESDIVCDLLKFPWPWKDESVEEAHCSHFFEHIPGRLRGRWMDELHRVLIPGGKTTIIVPHWASMRAVQDFNHEWPPVAMSSFLYFNRGWREANKLTHGCYDIRCDFDFSYADCIGPPWAQRAEEARSFALTHYLNVAYDLSVTLTKRDHNAGK